eukprot:364743-Chlamydomonas_euryale.AAC.92
MHRRTTTILCAHEHAGCPQPPEPAACKATHHGHGVQRVIVRADCKYLRAKLSRVTDLAQRFHASGCLSTCIAASWPTDVLGRCPPTSRAHSRPHRLRCWRIRCVVWAVMALASSPVEAACMVVLSPGHQQATESRGKEFIIEGCAKRPNLCMRCSAI